MTAPRQILLTDDENGVPPVPRNTPETSVDDAILLNGGELESGDLSSNVAMLAPASDPSDVVIDFSDYPVIEGAEYAENAWYYSEELAELDQAVVDESAVEGILVQMTEGAMSLDEVLQYRDAISNATRSEIERRYRAQQASGVNNSDGLDGQHQVTTVANTVNTGSLPSPNLARAIGRLFSGLAISPRQLDGHADQDQEKGNSKVRPAKSV